MFFRTKNKRKELNVFFMFFLFSLFFKTKNSFKIGNQRSPKMVSLNFQKLFSKIFFKNKNQTLPEFFDQMGSCKIEKITTIFKCHFLNEFFLKENNFIDSNLQ